MNIYLLYSEFEDESGNTLLGAYKEEFFARANLWNYVLNVLPTEELKETAADNGYESIEQFGEDVLQYADHDEDLGVRIEEIPLMEC